MEEKQSRAKKKKTRQRYGLEEVEEGYNSTPLVQLDIDIQRRS